MNYGRDAVMGLQKIKREKPVTIPHNKILNQHNYKESFPSTISKSVCLI